MTAGTLASDLLLFLITAFDRASAPLASKRPDAELKFVVYVSRHGVRSPTGKPEQYNPYSKHLGRLERCSRLSHRARLPFDGTVWRIRPMELASQGC